MLLWEYDERCGFEIYSTNQIMKVFQSIIIWYGGYSHIAECFVCSETSPPLLSLQLDSSLYFNDLSLLFLGLIQHLPSTYILSFLSIYLRPIVVDHSQARAVLCHFDIYTVFIFKAPYVPWLSYSPTSWHIHHLAKNHEYSRDKTAQSPANGDLTEHCLSDKNQPPFQACVSSRFPARDSWLEHGTTLLISCFYIWLDESMQSHLITKRRLWFVWSLARLQFE